MLERSNEDHSGFGEVEVSQKRAEGSRRALTREKNRILLSSSHRMSDDVSGFVSVTIVPVRTHRSDLPWPLTKSRQRVSQRHLPISLSFVDPLRARSRKWDRVYGPRRVDLTLIQGKHISFSFRAGYAREIRNENYLVKNFTTSFFSFPFLFHSK